MVKAQVALFGGALLVLSAGAYSQRSVSDPWQDEHVDCATASNPKGCRQRRARLQELQAEVRKVCDAKPEAERPACMIAEWCRNDPDPARCNEMQAKRAAAREACGSKPAAGQKGCLQDALAR